MGSFCPFLVSAFDGEIVKICAKYEDVCFPHQYCTLLTRRYRAYGVPETKHWGRVEYGKFEITQGDTIELDSVEARHFIVGCFANLTQFVSRKPVLHAILFNVDNLSVRAEKVVDLVKASRKVCHAKAVDAVQLRTALSTLWSAEDGVIEIARNQPTDQLTKRGTRRSVQPRARLQNPRRRQTAHRSQPRRRLHSTSQSASRYHVPPHHQIQINKYLSYSPP